MAKEFTVPQADTPPPLDANNKKPDRSSSGDSTGFGLINWLFDHVDQRKPIFMSLYVHYNDAVKIGSEHKWVALPLCLMCIVLDFIVFALYAFSIVAIVVGITFIFVKGTGALEYIFPARDGEAIKIQSTD